MMFSDDQDNHEEEKHEQPQRSNVFTEQQMDSMRFKSKSKPRHLRNPETFTEACCSSKGASLAFAFIAFGIIISTSNYFILRSQFQQFKAKHLTSPVTIPLEGTPQKTKEGSHLPTQTHKHQPQTFNYPVVGIPNPGSTFNYTVFKMEQFSKYDEQLLELLKPYTNTDCDYARYGQAHEGGYVLCKNFLRYSDGLINLGVGSKDNFGCDLTTEYTMPNYQYDCSDPIQPGCWSNQGMNSYHHICTGQITQNTDQYMFYTLQDVLKTHNLTKKHFTMKVNIEGSQYATLRYFPKNMLDYIDQIVVKFHFWGKNQYWGNLDIFKSLRQHFVPVNFHESNQKCQSSEMRVFRKLNSYKIEITFVNKRLIKIFSEQRSFEEHPLNAKNEPDRPLCK